MVFRLHHGWSAFGQGLFELGNLQSREPLVVKQREIFRLPEKRVTAEDACVFRIEFDIRRRGP